MFEGTIQALMQRRQQEQQNMQFKKQMQMHNVSTLMDLAAQIRQQKKIAQLGEVLGQLDPSSEKSLNDVYAKMAAIAPMEFGGAAVQYGAGRQAQQRAFTQERDLTGERIQAQKDIATMQVGSRERVAAADRAQQRQALWSGDIGRNAQIFTEKSLQEAQAGYERTGYIPAGKLRMRPEVEAMLTARGGSGSGGQTEFRPLTKDQWERTTATITSTQAFKQAMDANPQFQRQMVQKGWGPWKKRTSVDGEFVGKLDAGEQLGLQEKLDAERRKAYLSFLMYGGRDENGKPIKPNIPSEIQPYIKLLKASTANDPTALIEYIRALPKEIQSTIQIPDVVAGMVVGKPATGETTSDIEATFEELFGRQENPLP